MAEKQYRLTGGKMPPILMPSIAVEQVLHRNQEAPGRRFIFRPARQQMAPWLRRQDRNYMLAGLDSGQHFFYHLISFKFSCRHAVAFMMQPLLSRGSGPSLIGVFNQRHFIQCGQAETVIGVEFVC
jgi:hypothetical protein